MVKQTPVTLENVSTLFNKFQKHFDNKIDETKEELRAEFKHLPTKEEYYTREDKTMGDLYEKTNKRVSKIDKHLGIDTSSVF